MKYTLQSNNMMHGNTFLVRFGVNVLQIVVSTLIVLLIIDFIGIPRCTNDPLHPNVHGSQNRYDFSPSIGNRMQSIDSQELKDSNKPRPDSPVAKYRKCSQEAYATTSSVPDFVLKYRNCLSSFIPQFPYDKFHMGRFGEVKIFLPLKPDFPQTECNWVTVGIGGDSQVEKEFKQKYPGCSVYGVEASPDQYVDFADYGTIIPYGVGVVNGSFDLTVREGTKYLQKSVPVLSLAHLLDQYVKTRHVEYMTIDIEGFEYNILEQLVGGRKLAEEGIVFCQIDTELHELPTVKGKVRDFLNLFDDDDSDYVPVFTAPFLTHQKVTYVNFRDKDCLRAFNFSSLI